MNDSNGHQVDLAHAAPFSLGGLDVDPPHRAVTRDGERIIVEPRAMQLLVALHEADGAILSHDDLIERCWGGRIVGDNAIHRAVSRVRELAALGEGRDFTIETVKGVGYALHETGGTPRPVKSTLYETQMSRRNLVLGGGAVAIALASIAAWQWPQRSHDDRIERLIADAERLRRDEEEHIALPQADALYREAIAARPDHAPYRGALALLHCQLLDFELDEDLPSLDQKIREIVEGALALDPGEPMALAAAAIRPSPFGRWREAIAALEPLAGKEDADWQPKMALAQLYADIGDWETADLHTLAALKSQPRLQRAHGDLVWSAWGRGRIEEARQRLQDGARRWPRNYYFWATQFLFLAQQRDFPAARRHLADTERRPIRLIDNAIEKRLRLLELIENPQSPAMDEFKAMVLADALMAPSAVSGAAMSLGLVGAREDLVDVIRGAMFGEGPYAHKLTQLSRRPTAFLYSPIFDPYRDGNDFRAITERLGLPNRAKV